MRESAQSRRRESENAVQSDAAEKGTLIAIVMAAVKKDETKQTKTKQTIEEFIKCGAHSYFVGGGVLLTE